VCEERLKASQAARKHQGAEKAENDEGETREKDIKSQIPA
jgi:hypothetical protein